jgi:hypothetical protein
MKITFDSSSLPDAAGEIAYCFGRDMTATTAPSGAYCYIIEAAEDTGVFSTVGTNVPKLVFISSDNWGGSSVVTTEIAGTKYDIYNSASELAAADTDVFVNEAYFQYGWYMPTQNQGRKKIGETDAGGDRLNKKDGVTYYSTNANSAFDDFS